MSRNQSDANDPRHSQLVEPLRSAVIAHESGDLQKAYPLYRQFVADNPQHPTALQLFGLLLSQLGQYEPAIKLMRESLQLFPRQPEVANNLGNALLRVGLIDDAIGSYAEAIRLHPDYAEAQRNLGLAYSKASRHEEGVAVLEKCLAANAKDAAAWMAIGSIFLKLEQIERAMEAFEKAVELRPDYADAHHNLGVCKRLKQYPEEALEHYKKAQELGLDRPELHHNMGNAYIDIQLADPAIDAYREALRRNPADIDTHKNLNSLLWQQDQLDEYLASYRDVLAQDPEAEPLRIAYAAALNQSGSHETAEEVLREGLQYSQSGEIKSQLAYTLEEQGRWDEALLVHEGAVKTPGARPNHLISYGRALLACQKPDQALEQIKQGAASTPFNQRSLAYLGLCWRMLGDERDNLLNDYESMVVPYDLPMPDGYSSAAEFNERLQKALEPLHIGLRHPAEQTLRGGSQTSGNLFDRRDPEIQALVASLRPCIEDYIGRFPQMPEHPLYMRRTGQYDFNASWSVRLVDCGFHTMHTHPLGWISSAYYVQVPAVVAEDDRHGGGIKFGEPDIDIGEAGTARRQIQPTAGRLVLFPSYMWHGTVPFNSDEPRMTAPFDVVPV